MKKLMMVVSNLFGLVSITLMLTLSPVFAKECDADENLYMLSFTGSRDQIDEALGVKQESSVSTINTLLISFLEVPNISLTGSGNRCLNTSVAEAIQDKDYTPGALHHTLNSLSTLFESSPTGNIPSTYANLLLPKEFVKSNSVYAIGCGSLGLLTSPPTCQSASDYWNVMGISALWGVSFTIAMVIVIVVLIISGFMIMFRSKIGGQVVVTVSMALQNVIIGSGMALASYALGVFFINLSKYLMILIALLLAAAVKRASAGVWLFLELGGVTYLNEPLGLAVKLLFVLAWGDMTTVIGIPLGGFFDALKAGQSVLEGGNLLDFAGKMLGAFQGGLLQVAGLFTGGFWFLLLRLIITGGIFIAAIRIFWAVLKVYIKMVIDVVIAPVLFVIMAVPGKNTGISDWLSRMFKNAITPPLMFAAVNATIVLTLFLALHADDLAGTTSGTIGIPMGGAIPALTGGALSANTPVSQFWGIMSLGVGLHGIIMLVLLNMVPSIPKAVEDLFAAKSSGSLQKAGEEVTKRLQSIPLLGSVMK